MQLARFDTLTTEIQPQSPPSAHFLPIKTSPSTAKPLPTVKKQAKQQTASTNYPRVHLVKAQKGLQIKRKIPIETPISSSMSMTRLHGHLRQ
jgi:hypothetical protein